MFSQNKLISKILVVFVMAVMVLSACVPQPIAQLTQLPSPSKTSVPSATKTLDFSNITDADLESDRLDALKATTTSMTSLPNASDEEIAKVLLLKWFEYYKTNSINHDMRLKDYKIEQITSKGGCPPPDKDSSKSLVWIDFSVQPVNTDSSDWNAGSGESVPGDSWINHKVGYASVSASKGFYTLGFEGIPPCSG